MTISQMTGSLERCVKAVADDWCCEPVVRLACEGGSDEHYQIWHPAYLSKGDMPGFVWSNGFMQLHPDAPPGTICDFRSTNKIRKFLLNCPTYKGEMPYWIKALEK